MDIPDEALVNLFRINPANVPLVRVGHCMTLLSPDDREVLLRSLTRRRPKTDRERRILLHYAVSENLGGVLFIDTLGGFEGLTPC